VLYGHDGTGWLDAGRLAFTQDAFANTIVASGTSLWAFGNGTNVAEANSGAAQPDLPTTGYAAAAAPGNDAWVVGNRGMFARVSPGSPAVPVWPIVRSDIYNLFVTDELVYAAQNGVEHAILFRAGETWNVQTLLSGSAGHSWLAVAAVTTQGGTRVVWAVDSVGDLYVQTGAATPQRRLNLQPPFARDRPRSAATLPLPDGGALLGYGRAIVRLTDSTVLDYDGGAIMTMALPDGGSTAQNVFTAPVDMISGLAETSEALVVTGHLDSPKTSAVKVLRPGGAWEERIATQAQESIDDVTTCPDGSFVMAGDHGFLMRLDPTAMTLSQALTTPAPTSVAFASAWCGPNNEAWVLSRSGDVLRVDATARMPIRERTGWGRRDDGHSIRASTIRGNSSFVFISGGSSALISRPLCP
jgi:hypothetical protein